MPYFGLDPDFIRETYITPPPNPLVTQIQNPSTAVTSISGLSGPTVNLLGGSTGLSFSVGAPNITLSGTLVVANGGTGATTAAAARSNLSAAKSGANADLNTFSALTGSSGWAAWTGTADKTTHATGAATLQNVAEALKALLDTLLASGVIKI